MKIINNTPTKNIIKKIEPSNEIKKGKTRNVMHNPFTSNFQKQFMSFVDEDLTNGTLINESIIQNNDLHPFAITEYTKGSRFSFDNDIQNISIKEYQHKKIEERQISIKYNEIIPQLNADVELVRVFTSMSENPKIKITTNYRFKNFNDNQLKIIGKIFEYAQNNFESGNGKIRIKIKEFCTEIGLSSIIDNKRKIFYDFTNLGNTEMTFEYTTKNNREIRINSFLFAILGSGEANRIPQYITIHFGDWFEILKGFKEFQTYKKVGDNYFKTLSKSKINHGFRLWDHITSLYRNRMNKKDKTIAVSFKKIMELYSWSDKEIEKRISEKAEFLEKILLELRKEFEIEYKWKKGSKTKKLIDIYKNSTIYFDCQVLDKNYY